MKNIILSFIFVITGLFATCFAVAKTVTKVIDGRQVSGRLHKNGGGFVADTAQVEPTAYVGKMAIVSGNAQVFDIVTVSGKRNSYWQCKTH